MEKPWQVDVPTAAAMLETGALLIDVREADELAAFAVPGAQHVPMREIPAALPSLPRDRDLLVLCHSGGRSMRVTQFLRANGLSRVSNVEGGILAWVQHSGPSGGRA